MKRFIKDYWAFSIPLIVLIIAILFLVKRNPDHRDNRVIGMVEAEFTDVGSSLPGRLDSLLVQQGDTVQKGQLLAIIKGTEVDNIEKQALAAIQAAQGQVDLLKNGARPAIIQSAKNLQDIAQHQFDLAQKTYERMQNLYKDSVISGQEKDMVYFKYQAAKKELESAEAHAKSLERGSRPEMIQTAEAILKQAQYAYEITNSIAKKTKIYAPASGIIASLITHQGEIVNLGYPMMTIQKHGTYYIKFNIRQDRMKAIKIGDKVKIRIPGINSKNVEGRIDKIAPALEFANWIPQEKSGQFELRTFGVQIKPVSGHEDLRPGMTAAMDIPH